MAVVLSAASYSRIGFSLYFAVRARRVRVPVGSKFNLAPGTIIISPLEGSQSFQFVILSSCHLQEMQQFIRASVYYFNLLKMLLYYKKFTDKQEKFRRLLLDFIAKYQSIRFSCNLSDKPADLTCKFSRHKGLF